MISIEILPGTWWRQIDTSDLPQDGQRLIAELEKRFVYWFINAMHLDFERFKEKLKEQFREACLQMLMNGMMPLHWNWELNSTESTNKHFLRDNDGNIKAYIECVNGEVHSWDSKRVDKLCGVSYE